MAQTFTIETGGQERTYSLRPNLPLAVREWWSRLIDAWTASDDYARYEELLHSDKVTGTDAGAFMYACLVRIACRDRDLLTGGMRTGYIGNHAGVEWYDEIDGDVTNPAIADLISLFFVKAAKTMSASLTSSRLTPTDSEATTPEDTAPSSTGN